MLVNEPSRTARAVAAVRLGAPRVQTPYANPVAAEQLERSVAGPDGVPDSLLVDYLVARTWFFDQVVVDAIESGSTQIVIAAAGYDTRAIRYAKPGVRWFELDHPTTQADKVRRVAEIGVGADHISFVAADFTVDDVAERLAVAGCDPAQESLVLAEGIAVYLSLETLGDLLSGLRRSVAGASRLAISLSVAVDSPELAKRRAAFQERVAAVGEPTRSVLTVEQSNGLLRECGWRVDDTVDPAGPPGRVGLVTATAVDLPGH